MIQNNIIFSKMKKISTVFACFLGLLLCDYNYSLAQAPDNDSICNATTLPLDGSCIVGDSNNTATPDYYGGCINSNYPSVFYTFELTGSNNAVDINFENIAPAGKDVSIFLLEGPCTSPSGISTKCNQTTFTFINLSVGIEYILLVCTNPGQGNLSNYDICATQYDAAGSITGPEQDCAGAIYVCESTYIQESSYTGYWENQELPYGQTCLVGGENNSVWYIFTAQTDGDLVFMIETTKDYDFALYDITTIGCAGIPSADPATNPVRCNYSDNPGPTGLVTPTADKLPVISYGYLKQETMPGVIMTAGETYVLIIDNWTGDDEGYTLDFGSSPVVDVTAPTIVSAAASCTDNTILITMSEDIQCLSVVYNGFVLENITTSQNFTDSITHVIGYNCPQTDGALTSQIQITHNGTLTSGVYKITMNPPTPEDKCGNSVADGSTVNFNYLASISLASTNPASGIICSGENAELTASGAPSGITYTLNPGNLQNTTGVFNVNPATTTNYTVAVTYGGCTKTASQLITVQDNIIVSITPTDPTICSGSINLIASATINGVPCGDCTFLWSTAETNDTISALGGDPGEKYYVDATTPEECTSDNTDTSTVSFASAGAGATCDVLYVSPTGLATNDGLTKSTPTTLDSALARALCTNTVIKMQTGIYNYDHYIEVNSYVTIEGGYAADFYTKSSNMSGEANSTTIRRDNTVDSDNDKTCTAFRVVNSADDFRFQDLRIELPGADPLVSNPVNPPGEVTNYGIHIFETGSTGYSIVRCYIDAGVGSDQP